MADMEKMDQILGLLDEMGQEYPEQSKKLSQMGSELQGLFGDEEMDEEAAMDEEMDFMAEEDMEDDEEMSEDELEKLLG